MAALYFLLVCILSAALTSADRARFVPFGVAQGDTEGAHCDDCNVAESVPFPITVVGTNVTEFVVNNNGYIFSRPGFTTYISLTSMDFDTRQENGGAVYFGPRTDAAFLSTMSRKVSNTFHGVRAYVVTYDNVGLFNRNNNIRHSAQLVLIVDASGDTWAFIYYGPMTLGSWISVFGNGNDYFYRGIRNTEPADVIDLKVHVSSTPPTFAPAPVVVDICGDGVVNGNEQCDGGECCTATCTFKDTAYCYCERQTFVGGEYAQNYFCDSSRPTQYYQCLQGPWSPMSSLMPCPAGTSCGCANGSECSCGGTASPCVTAGTQQTC